MQSRWIAFLMAAASCVAVKPLPANGQAKLTGPEQTLLQLANRERTALGLKPLAWNAALAVAARAHALRMAQQPALSHQYPGEMGMADRAAKAGARFSSIAENIAEGPQVETMHAEWMESPPHRANILDPQLDAVGIAVVSAKGTSFAVQDFAKIVAVLSIEEQEKAVASQLQQAGLALLPDNSEARKTCLLQDGFAGKTQPAFIVRYETPNLQDVPALLVEQVKSGQYHTASVGACVRPGISDFTQYRIAVLLF